ncbi:Lipoxygenase, partial [Thalictrum thalictroides]
MGRWLWRLNNGEDSLWKQVIREKYGKEDLGWFTKKINHSHKCSMWKDIMKGSEEFMRRVKMEVEKGDRTLFWLDKWFGEDSLKSLYPNLYNRAMDKKGTVAAHIKWEGGIQQWDLKGRNFLYEWKVEE